MKESEGSPLDIDTYRAALLEAVAGRLVHADEPRSRLSAAEVLAVGRALLGATHPAVVRPGSTMPAPRLCVRHHTHGLKQVVIPVPRDCLTVEVPAVQGRPGLSVCVNTKGIVLESLDKQRAAYEFADLLPGGSRRRGG